MRGVLAWLTVALVPVTVSAGWMDVVRADGNGRLAAARSAALEVVRADPASAEAVAAAAWWLSRADVLREPEELLELPLHDPTPDLAFVLGSLSARLRGEVPAGSTPRAELAGPFGGFDLLDLERGVWPADPDLPAMGATWGDDGRPFRLELATADGWVAPPRALLRPGVYLAAWTVTAAEETRGWLVVELDANADIELDGATVARPRPVNDLGPAVLWFRVQLRAGRHRLRVAMASPKVPRVRVRWLGDRGEPLALAEAGGSDGGAWAGSEARPGLPPVEDAFRTGLEERSSLETRLVAAALASLREAPLEERRQLEASVAEAPGEPWGHLAMAGFYLTEPTGAAASVDYRRCREELARSGGLPGALVLERELDLRQRRQEDAEAILDRLLERVPGDARVQILGVQRAIRRGWTREIEEGLSRLASVIPGSPTLVDLELDGARAMDRLDRYTARLQALAAGEPFHGGLLDRLQDTTLDGAALAVVEALRSRRDDPELDMERVRLLQHAGRVSEARTALEAARERWGSLYQIDQLGLQLAMESGQRSDAERALQQALGHDPASVDLRLLQWRWGERPFYQPWRTDGLELVRRARAAEEGDADSVLVLDQAVERVFPDGSSLHYYHGMTLAHTPEGAKQAAALNILPGAELLTVRILKKDGTVKVPADLSPDPGTTLAHVEPGDVVEQEYVAAIDRAVGLGRGHMSPYIYRFADADRAFGLSEYVLLHPADLQLSIEGNLEGVTREERPAGDLVATSFRVEQVPPIPMEPFAPPAQELLPWVTYGFGVTWADVGDIVRDRVLRLLRGSPELSSWAQPLLAGDGTPRARLQRLVSALVEKVERGDGLLDPDSTAGRSFSIGRGNRLAILLQVLAENGWETDLVLTRPLVYAGTHLQVPTMEAFGVPLLRVRKGEATLWIDLAEEAAGVDHIRPQFQGSDGLLLPITRPRTRPSYLEELPRFENPEEAERTTLRARVKTDGSAELVVEVSLRGDQARRLVDAVRSLPEERVGMLYQQVAAGLFRGATGVTGTILDPDGHPVLSLSLHLDGACEAEGRGLVCRQLTLPRPISPALASLPERRFPLVLQLPLIRVHRLELHLPEGWQAGGTTRHFTSEWGSVEEERKAHGSTLESTLTLRIPAQKVPPERYPEFARFCHAVDELVTRPVRLVPAP